MNNRLLLLAAICLMLFLSPGAEAGLYYSGEPIAELPSQWRGFLLDQRALRNVAVKPPAGQPANPTRVEYLEAAARLEKAAGERKLTADEQADLGALFIRVGEVGKALELLRSAYRAHPEHFRIVANLGTAWQLQGDPEQASYCLQQAVRLAPGRYQRAEELQLKLIRQRQRQPRGEDLDDLFGVRFGGEGKYEPGKLAADDRKKLPSDAVALVQQLALWLPADSRLLWQLAELANAHGDVQIAASIMDGCVTEFGLRSARLREHRQATRALVEERARRTGPGGEVTKTAHEGHAGMLKTRSRRPLLNRADLANLPPISATGVNALPWALLGETALDRNFRPTFAKYLKELDGKQIALSGFMQPLGDDLEPTSFMLIEYPVGCWYCEMPEVTGIVFVEIEGGKTAQYSRGLVKVVGKLSLNATDPENFLYTLGRARVAEAD